MSPSTDMSVSLIGMAICIFLGIIGFRNHFKKHTTIKPHRLPWMIISLAAIATGFMLLVHVVNLFGLETGRNR
jgi:Na+/melibiose symporter-like transporter